MKGRYRAQPENDKIASITDPRRGREVKDDSLDFAFKTPTIRSVALRAP
jgi:cytochrome c peroxidase